MIMSIDFVKFFTLPTPYGDNGYIRITVIFPKVDILKTVYCNNGCL